MRNLDAERIRIQRLRAAQDISRDAEAKLRCEQMARLCGRFPATLREIVHLRRQMSASAVRA